MRKTLVIALLLLASISSLFSNAASEKYTPASQLKGEAAASLAKAQEEENVTISEMLYSLGNLYTFLDTNYLWSVDSKKMQINLIKAMVSSLGDKYSYYITPDEAEDFKESSQGDYVGIGTYLTKVNPDYIDPKDPSTYMVIITSPFPGGPADRAGIRAKDMISHVNGEDVSKLTSTEASKLIRGKEGENITLTIHRGDAVFDITLQPEVVTTPTTSKTILDGDIGYLFISSFTSHTYDNFNKDMNYLLDNGAKKIILDLRNNGGGYVDDSLKIANSFVSEGKLLTAHYKNSNNTVVYNATATTLVPEDYPVIILVNEGTASASEILTAALKENNRATVIGSKTYGKGVMQSEIPYLGGYLCIVTSSYTTPLDNDIHEKGITPDIIIEEEEYTDEDLKAYSEFLKTDKVKEYIKENPEYSKENILRFADLNKDSEVPYTLLCLLIRNEYIYNIDYDKRPIADPEFDNVLKCAIEEINK